ncbi:TPA: hypothetical protein ACH3X1_009224 [Trebouxia sp. C0004]
MRKQSSISGSKAKQCKCAAAIAARVQQKYILKVSVSTVQHTLRRAGLKHLRPKVVPMLTAKQKHTGIKFGTAAQRTDTVCWRDTMITDSSIFRMHPTGKPAGSWRTQATRGTVQRPKHSLIVHCYMGMTYCGVTTLKFVTGTHKLAQKYPKTKRAFTGVGSKEYNEGLTSRSECLCAQVDYGNMPHEDPAYGHAVCVKTTQSARVVLARF